MPTVLIADDHSFIRRGIKGILADFSGWQVSGEAENGKEAIELAAELHPDVVLLDVSMPGVTGLEAARVIRKQNPEAKIILLTLHDSQELIRNAFRAGVNGYLLKTDAEAELIRALRIVLDDGTYLSPRLDPTFVKNLVANLGGTPPH